MFQPKVETQPETLTKGILEVKPLTRCNSADTIKRLRDQDQGLYTFRPLNNEKYHYVLPQDKDRKRHYCPIFLRICKMGFKASSS